MSIATIFSRPYPLPQDRRERVFLCIAISAFVTFFLLAFRPFGLAVLPAYQILGYGLITGLAVVLSFFVFPALFPQRFNEERWTAGREILWSLFTVSLIGTGNFLYTVALGYSPFHLLNFLYFECITFAVAVFPLTFMVLFRQNRSMKKYIREAAEISRALHTEEEGDQTAAPRTISLRGDDGKTLLEFAADDFLFAAAADNYVEVVLSGTGNISSHLVRITMAKFSEQIPSGSRLYRCHRSYIVHLGRVTEVRANSQGLRLLLAEAGREIPVARSKSREIKELLT